MNDVAVLIASLSITAIAFIFLAWRMHDVEKVTRDLLHCRGQLNALSRELMSLQQLIRDIISALITIGDGNVDLRHNLKVSLQRQLRETNRLLHLLDEQIAMYTPNSTPVHLLAEKERLQEYLRSLQQQLDRLEDSHELS
jgi:chromosome segregation ATPase